MRDELDWLEDTSDDPRKSMFIEDYNIYSLQLFFFFKNQAVS